MNLLRLPPGPNPPDVVNAIVEIPRGGKNKYEYDSTLEVFRLDRVLHSSVHYPTAYGFVPGTRGADGDPLDILVITTEATFTGCLIAARPIGLFLMRDEKGDDEKVLAVPIADPRYSEYTDLSHVAPHFLREIEHFFTVYKDLEGKRVDTFGWDDRDAAHEAIQRAIAAADGKA